MIAERRERVIRFAWADRATTICRRTPKSATNTVKVGDRRYGDGVGRVGRARIVCADIVVTGCDRVGDTRGGRSRYGVDQGLAASRTGKAHVGHVDFAGVRGDPIDPCDRPTAIAGTVVLKNLHRPYPRTGSDADEPGEAARGSRSRDMRAMSDTIRRGTVTAAARPRVAAGAVGLAEDIQVWIIRHPGVDNRDIDIDRGIQREIVETVGAERPADVPLRAVIGVDAEHAGRQVDTGDRIRIAVLLDVGDIGVVGEGRGGGRRHARGKAF